MGRLTRDPEVRYTQGNESMCIANYTLAVDRRYKREGEETADFVSIKAFSKAAEFAEKYLKKGTKVVVTGRIQTGSYTNKDGVKVYTTDVIAEDQEFAESKKVEGTQNTEPSLEQPPFAQPSLEQPGFLNVPDDEDLPFAQPSR